MSDDIVARLRESDGGYFMRQMFTEAADEIERLRELSGDTGRLREKRDDLEGALTPWETARQQI